jgi:hypothetical protein
MKERLNTILTIALLLMLFGSLCWAQQATGPQINLMEREFDAGEVFTGSIIEHSFRFVNQGDSPLEITKVKPG